MILLLIACQWQSKIPHPRRNKNPQLGRNKIPHPHENVHSSRGGRDDPRGGISHDTGFSTRTGDNHWTHQHQ